jgi:hypothetical protein
MAVGLPTVRLCCVGEVTDHYPEERMNTMSDSLTDLMLCDEETLSQELPDAALEVAAGKFWEVGNPFTIAFCSGLDTCPA